MRKLVVSEYHGPLSNDQLFYSAIAFIDTSQLCIYFLWLSTTMLSYRQSFEFGAAQRGYITAHVRNMYSNQPSYTELGK